MNWNSYCSSLISYGSSNRLSNPPCSISRKFKPFSKIKFFYCTHDASWRRASVQKSRVCTPGRHAAVHTVHRTARRGLSAQGQKLVYHICGLRICGQRGQRDGHYRTPPPAAAKRLLTNRFRFAILKNSSYAAVFYAHPGTLCPGA